MVSVGATWGTPLWGTGLWGTIEDYAGTSPEYHVVLGGVGLLLKDRGSWERRLGQEYAAKLSTGAGTTQNDRLRDQTVLIDGWQGGEGTKRHVPTAPSRYFAGAGIDIFSESGSLGLGPRMQAPAALQTAFDELSAMIVYRGYLIVGTGTGKVYRWDGTNFDLAIDTAKAGGIRSFAIWETNLYVGNGTDGSVWRWIGSTLLTTFAANFTVGAYSGGTVSGVHCLTPFIKGSVLSAEYGASSDNNAMFGEWVNTAGTTSSATAGTLIAHESRATVLIAYQEAMIAVAADTTNKTWRLYEGSDASVTTWVYKLTMEGGYPICGAVLDDILYLGDAVGGKIWKWDGNDLTLYHKFGTDEVPYTAEIRGMVAWRGGLWVGIVDTDGTMAIARDNGSSDWSRPVTGLTGTTTGVLCVFQDKLHYVTNATGASKIWRTDGTFVGTGYAQSALIDAQLGGTDKLWVGVNVVHSALAATQSVEVQYRVNDTGSWTTLGTSSTDGATSASCDFPSAITADLIAFKIILTGTAGSSTALKVYSLSARYRPAPGAKREWSLKVNLQGTTARSVRRLDGTAEPLTGEEISAEVWALVEAVAPVTLLDIDRTEYTVWITEYSEALDGALPQIGALDVGFDLAGSLRLTEV